MNIVRALNVALPELPERVVRENPQRLDPTVIAKEHMEKGQPVVLAKKPGTDLVFRFSPLQWKLIQMFDGLRSPAEVSEHFRQETGTAVTEEDVQELGSYLQNDTPLFYKTAVEKNIALQQGLRSSRNKRSRFKGLDFADITIKTWNNADDYISWLYPKLRFLFTPWFVWTSLGMFVVMGGMWADRFGEVWSDSFAFYNFTNKSGSDLIEFWFLFAAMAAIHETGHGLVGKHFGATIEKMGFGLMYFAPTFICDATQVWIIAGKWARVATAIAGIWIDLVVCFFATIVWWGTTTGMSAHDWAYKVMLVTGIGVTVLNLNPLIKLDGYLIFSELVAEPSLKESSTAYLSGWTRKYIFRLPVEVPYVPRRKRSFFVIYGILSGLYSYSLLSFLMILTYHILRSFSSEWAFVPALAIGYWVFESRIKLLVKFMKMLYLDKKERLHAWFTPVRLTLAATAALLVVFLPIWPDFVQGRFILAAAKTADLRTTVPGTVTRVLVQEGDRVSLGEPLLRLQNLDLESRAAQAKAELSRARAGATQAALRYTDFGTAEQERRHRAENDRLLTAEAEQLSVVSPVPGTVITAHTSDLVSRSLDEGDFLLKISDFSEMKGRVYIPEFSLHDVRIGQKVRLLAKGAISPLTGTLSQVAPVSASDEDGLIPKQQLQGMNPSRYYVGTVVVQNDGHLAAGMTGSAKILVARRSLAGFGFRFCRELVERKVW